MNAKREQADLTPIAGDRVFLPTVLETLAPTGFGTIARAHASG